MKTRQIMHFTNNGEFFVIKNYKEKNNNYHIYKRYYAYDENGRVKQHKKQLAKYDDLASCFYWFLQNVNLY